MEDVILRRPKVAKNKAVQHASHDIIQKSLEVRCSIGQTKIHYQVLIMTTRCVEGCLQFVPLLNDYQMIGVVQVKLEKDGGSLQQFESRRHQKQWITVITSDFIQPL